MDDANVVGNGGRELGTPSAYAHGGIRDRLSPRIVRAVGCRPYQRAERGSAHARIRVAVEGSEQPRVCGGVEGCVVAESRELGGAGHGARVGHGSRPLIAMTRPANTVASTAATRKPVNATSKSMRTKAVPRRATRIPRVGPDRVPNGIGGVAGCGAGVPVKRSTPRARGCTPNYPPLDRSPMTDHIPATAPPPEQPPPTPSRRHTVIAVVLSTVGVLIAAVVIAGFLIHLPYVIISPGSATPLDSDVVQIDGAKTYPDDARNIRFLTVQVSTRKPNAWRVLTSWLDPDRDVEERSTVQGCLSDAQNQQFNSELMDQSQNDAKYVALTRLGYDVPANPVQVRVVEVCRDAPAHGALEIGDQVLAVDGTDVADAAGIGTLVRMHRPGDRVAITYDRNGVTRTASIRAGRYARDGTTCVPANGSTSGRICLGVSSQEFVTYQFPVNVKINTELVGGPSAGLAFTLAIIDDLTPGSLTGGRQVAVTGTIEPDGHVGEVGGVEQKAITARTNGVHLMIVPKEEVKAARRGAGDVRVVGVDNVDEALDALHRAGGSRVPPTSATAARS
jgi:PDZ domain-containing protein